MFTIIDGVVGGENNGPLTPDPKPAGVLIASEHMIAADLVATRLMGFDPLGLKLYRKLLETSHFDLGLPSPEEIPIHSSEPEWESCLTNDSESYLCFRPHPGWEGMMEVRPKPVTQLVCA